MLLFFECRQHDMHYMCSSRAWKLYGSSSLKQKTSYSVASLSHFHWTELCFYFPHCVFCLSSSSQCSVVFLSPFVVKKGIVPIQVLLNVQCCVKQQPSAELPMRADEELHCRLRKPRLEGNKTSQKHLDESEADYFKSVVKLTITFESINTRFLKAKHLFFF